MQRPACRWLSVAARRSCRTGHFSQFANFESVDSVGAKSHQISAAHLVRLRTRFNFEIGPTSRCQVRGILRPHSNDRLSNLLERFRLSFLHSALAISNVCFVGHSRQSGIRRAKAVSGRSFTYRRDGSFARHYGRSPAPCQCLKADGLLFNFIRIGRRLECRGKRNFRFWV